MSVCVYSLLGPSAHDALQLTMNSGSLRDPPFLLSDPQDFRVITHRSDDDWLDLTVREVRSHGKRGEMSR